MTKGNHHTQEKILSAAEIIFHENGFKGARTTLIAKNAGISRTMLHYYYRTKEELFLEVSKRSLGFFIENTQALFDGNTDLKSFINSTVDSLCDTLKIKPSLANFFVNILNENPSLITDLPFIESENIPMLFDKLLKKAYQKKEVSIKISGEDLFLNICGLCAVPYLCSPLIKFKEGRTEKEMEDFFLKRKKMIKAFVWNGLQINN